MGKQGEADFVVGFGAVEEMGLFRFEWGVRVV